MEVVNATKTGNGFVASYKTCCGTAADIDGAFRALADAINEAWAYGEISDDEKHFAIGSINHARANNALASA